ncbi:protocatechuate dioxygenase [Neptunitalea chrysea]|uniref:Protocatechuate dioxygenase n=1 Tax=Neptunitalea chrysea TaxID=1647581 RepID=A0A9W6B499_9FLAO|nr:intradiol ring-cleavage dioxygenase [Neptunitalea chrysea]GLB52456.1 protocatechuate dioxygenase [Neptunitalea chrysea]
MKRKDFLKKGLVGMGTIVALPRVISSCTAEDDTITETSSDTTDTESNSDANCELSPSETAGPFPILSPADLVRANIISDRAGIALLITLTVQDQSDDCNPLAGVYVDIWHCDADGNYSEYGGSQMQSTDYTDKHFLRGRQTTDDNGQVSFISIFPGWYSGRAPHIHLEVLDSNENSLRVSQIAFPEDICETVYDTSDYHGSADTENDTDNVFSDSLDGNIADSLTGNTTDGYTLLKTIVV